MKEADIIHQAGPYWVGRVAGGYEVRQDLDGHSATLAVFARDADGQSNALAYCDYLQKAAEHKTGKQ